MSDAGATAEPTVTTDGITVTKSYESEEFPVPAVAFEISSDREDEAMVELTDTVPDGVPTEDLGFHPDYGSDHWTIEEGNAVFERRLDPDETYQTVYGIRTSDHDSERFMTEPELTVRGLSDDTETAESDETETTDETESVDDTATTPGRDSSQAARDVITGKSVSGLDDEGGVEEVDISGADTTETTEATEAATTETADETESNEATAATETGSRTDETDMTVSEGGIGAALAAEIRDGDLSETDRELLVEELTEDDAGSEVRLTHLQSRISDLEAYTDALEDFIDEHGPARRLIEDMTEQLETIEAELDTLDERTTANEDDIAALDDRTKKNETDIDSLDKGIADAQAEIDETQESIEDLREDIAAINDWRARISDVLGGVSESDDQS